MSPLPSARFVVDPQASDRIIRHIRRNEKSLLVNALARLEIKADAPLVQDEWFKAACHKNGAGVSTILVQANIRCGHDASLRKAIERGLWDVVRAQLPAIDFLSPLLDYAPLEHVLVKAAEAGQADLVDQLLHKAMLPAPNPKLPPLLVADKATGILRTLCASTREHLGHEVVPCLASAGARLSEIVENGGSWQRTTMVGAALSRGHFDLARALVAAGADPHVQVRAGTGPTAMFRSWLCSIMKRYDRNAQLPPKAWSGLALLQELGLEWPELEDMDTYFRFKEDTQLYLSRPDGDRLQAMALHRKMERETPAAAARSRGGPRL